MTVIVSVDLFASIAQVSSAIRTPEPFALYASHATVADSGRVDKRRQVRCNVVSKMMPGIVRGTLFTSRITVPHGSQWGACGYFVSDFESIKGNTKCSTNTAYNAGSIGYGASSGR